MSRGGGNIHHDVCVEVGYFAALHQGWRKQWGADVGGRSGGHILPNAGGLSVPPKIKNNSVEIFVEM